MQRPSATCHLMISELVAELLLLAPKVHSLHLNVTGLGSFAKHKALNEFYDSIPGLADSIAEGWQGYNEKLLNQVDCKIPIFTNTQDLLTFLRRIHGKITETQKMIPSDASEIVNDLDVIKSEINSLKYKLLFLE